MRTVYYSHVNAVNCACHVFVQRAVDADADVDVDVDVVLS